MKTNQLQALRMYEHDYLAWLQAKKNYPGLDHPKPTSRYGFPRVVLQALEDRVDRDFNRPVA